MKKSDFGNVLFFAGVLDLSQLDVAAKPSISSFMYSVPMNRIRSKTAGTIDQQGTIPETTDDASVTRRNNIDAPICPGCNTVLMVGIRYGWGRGFSLRCPMCYRVCTSG